MVLFRRCWAVLYFVFVSLWEPRRAPVSTSSARYELHLINKDQPIDALGLSCIELRLFVSGWILPHSARHGELIKKPKNAWQTGGTKEHTRTHTHIQKKTTNNAVLILFTVVNTFHNRKTLNQQPIPWVCCQRTWRMERVGLVINMIHGALSALKASVQWKGT